MMILFDKVYKSYYKDVDFARKKTFQRIFFPTHGTFIKEKEFYALQNISFSLKEGEKLLVVGPPRSGKTTVAKLICQLIYPTKGKVEIKGKTRWVGSVRVGCTPFMSLKEYISLLLALYGVSRRNISKVSTAIIERCQAGEFFSKKIADVPHILLRDISYYTSIYTDADIYVFDGMLISKRDNSSFEEICRERIKKIMRNNTVVITTREMKEHFEEEFKIDKLLFLKEGRCIYEGDIKKEYIMYSLNIFLREIDSYFEGEKEISSLAEKVSFIYKKYRKELSNDDNFVISSGVSAMFEKKIEESRIMDKKCLIVGPYISDVGLEFIYWIPFLKWLFQRYRLTKKKTVFISRCGMGYLYKGVGCGEYIDICSLMSEDEFVRMIENLQTTNMKPLTISPYERGIIDKVVEKSKVKEYALMHPSIVFKLFLPVWKGLISPEPIFKFTIYDKITPPLDELRIKDLPKKYIAVKLSFCSHLPFGEENEEIFRIIVEELSKRYMLVDLSAGIQLDKHKEFLYSRKNKNIYFLKDRKVSYEELINIQLQIIKGACLCIGTHSNITSLGAFMGVKTINLYSEEKGVFLADRLILGSYLKEKLSLPIYSFKVGKSNISLLLDKISGLVN